MRRILFVLAIILGGVSVVAARPSTTTMSCAQAAATVAKAGAIVLATGEHTYARFAAHNGFCGAGQTVQPARAPTLDDPQCQVGYECFDQQNDENH